MFRGSALNPLSAVEIAIAKKAQARALAADIDNPKVIGRVENLLIGRRRWVCFGGTWRKLIVDRDNRGYYFDDRSGKISFSDCEFYVTRSKNHPVVRRAAAGGDDHDNQQ